MKKLVPPPPPPPTPEEKKEIDETREAEGLAPVEANEWAEWNWLEKKEKDPCADRTDCTWKCVQATDIPADYKKNKDLSAMAGKCGFKYQITNKNEFANFTMTVLRAGASSLAMPALGAAAIALTMF